MKKLSRNYVSYVNSMWKKVLPLKLTPLHLRTGETWEVTRIYSYCLKLNCVLKNCKHFSWNMANYRSNNGVDNRSIYQMNDNMSYSSIQSQSPHHSIPNNTLTNNNLYKQDVIQSIHSNATNQNLRFHLQAQNQQIQSSNFHILSRHYLGQQQQQHHQNQHFQYQHHASRQHHMMNMALSSSVPLNASESLSTFSWDNIRSRLF